MPSERVQRIASSLPKVRSFDEAVQLAESFGITVHLFPLVDAQGVLVTLRGKSYIAVDPRLRECEKALTVLHELGHFFLHHNNQLAPRFFGSEFLEAQEEREADEFAWELLSDGLREDLMNPPEEGWAE